MDIERELGLLLRSGLNFSIEVDGRSVLVWVGDYLKTHVAATSVASVDQAVEWLRGYAGGTALIPA